MHHLATGIFGWHADERRSNRYGAFHATKTGYADVPAGVPTVTHRETIRSLEGRRVRVVAKVIETRASGHIGDLFLGLFPKPAPIGAEIELGIGTLRTAPNDYNQTTLELLIEPDSPRDEFWIDPRLFYALHDQTVEIWAEESAAAAHPVYQPTSNGSEEGIVTPTEPNTLQIKTKRPMTEDMRIEPDIERLGDGLFIMSGPSMKPGARHRLV